MYHRFIKSLGMLFFLYASVAECAERTAYTHVSPENTVFAFDFHDVVAHQSTSRLVAELGKVIWHADNKGALLKDSMGIMRDARKLKKKYDVFDDVLDELAVRYPSLKPHAQKIHDVVNAHTLSTEMVTLIKQLKAQGYRVYMVSNISPKSLETMYRKEPRIEGLFDAVYTAHQCRPNTNERYVNEVKPHPLYYKGFRAYLQDIAPRDAAKKIIFVDDKQKNIDGAHKGDKNLIGIRFTSISKFEKDLLSKGIAIRRHRMHVCSDVVCLNEIDDCVEGVIV
jgi:FMN phosphatase YigB (HAD superfamily)